MYMHDKYLKARGLIHTVGLAVLGILLVSKFVRPMTSAGVPPPDTEFPPADHSKRKQKGKMTLTAI
jgi:hypothetical protein